MITSEEKMRGILPEFIRRDVERAIEAAIHPNGMSVHDGKALIGADRLQYMLNFIDQAALQQESEAETVKAFRHKDTGEIRYALSTPPHDETEWEDVYISTATPSAQAIETAAIMKCVEMLEDRAKEWDKITTGTHASSYAGELRFMCKAILALIPQDGRTQLEEFGMKAAKLVYAEFVKYGQTNDIPKLRAIVTNLIGEKK